MKPPDHPTPSGDREIARGIIAALKFGGHEVTLATRFRSREGRGDAEAQARLIAQAEQELAEVLARPEVQATSVWVTYHNYYKAPDLIGPRAAAALGIPYVQLESTRARKRLDGPWALFAEAAEAASEAAAAIFYFTARDGEALRSYAPEGQTLVHLQPFLNLAEAPAPGLHQGGLLAVGMMRHGDKLESYTLLAQAFALLPAGQSWSLTLIGDGAARAEVEALFAPFGDRVTFLGACDAAGVQAAMAEASAFVWPGVNEAFGMVYLEAQAAGLPVIAQDRPGVRDVVHGPLVPVETGAAGYAAAIADMLTDDAARQSRGQAAREMIEAQHLLPAAAARLSAVLEGLV